MRRASSPETKRRNCQKFSPDPARLRPCKPWITVAAMRRASRISRGILAAAARALPPARWNALPSSRVPGRAAAIKSSDARLELADYAFDGLAVGARGEGQRHTVLEHRFGERKHVIDRRREPSVKQSARAREQHERLA